MEISFHEPPACGTWQYWCLAAEGDVGVCTDRERSTVGRLYSAVLLGCAFGGTVKHCLAQ